MVKEKKNKAELSKELRVLVDAVRYRVEIDGGVANADAWNLAELLDWHVEEVLERAKEGNVLEDNGWRVKILKITKATVPSYYLRAQRFRIRINGKKTEANAKVILELAGLEKEDFNRLKPGAKFEHDGRKIEILGKTKRETMVRSTF